jgi:NAD(P)-dependent dehydrogenase (short-subunit alcohol dehydrogenase family)
MPLAADLLRPGLLAGLRVATAGGAAGPAAACAALGAQVADLGAELLDEDAVLAAAEAARDVRALVADAATPFTGGQDGFRAALDGGWKATRAVFRAALQPAGDGLVVLLAPPPGDDPFAAALRAALENTARTTSVEWARFGVRVVAVLPGPATAPDELDALVAWLVSPAGAYFSGCALSLR